MYFLLDDPNKTRKEQQNKGGVLRIIKSQIVYPSKTDIAGLNASIRTGS